MKRKILFLVIRVIVSISLIGFLLYKLGIKNLEGFPTYLRSASYPFLVISILILAIAVILTAIRWKKLLEVQDIEIKFGPICKLTFISFFFANFMPGVVGGDAVKLYYTVKNTRRTADSFVSIFLDRLLGMSALLVIAVFSAVFLINIPEIRTISLFIFSLFILFLIAAFLFFNLKILLILRRLYKIKPFDLGNKIKKFKNAIIVYRKRKGILVYTFSLSIVVQLLIVVVSYFVAPFLNLHIPIRYFFLFVPLIQLIMSIPITVAGIGTREWAFIFFFTTISGLITKMDAFALSIGYYLTTLIASIPGGIAYLLRGGELKSK